MSDNLRAMLAAINQRLKESRARGDLALNLGYSEVLDTAAGFGIARGEAEEIARRLYYEGFVEGHLAKSYNTRGDGTRVPSARIRIDYLTSKGMREIGESPDET